MKEKSNKTAAYESPKQDWWQGRHDGNRPEQLRWWQHVQTRSLADELPDFGHAPVLLGFACDEGVARNKGRTGSAEGPSKLRKALTNLPIHNAEVPLFDVGTVQCIGTQLEEAQERLAQGVQAILEHNGFPIILGGGHETLYGHFGGVAAHHAQKNVGTINFDAHFDIRKPASSGVSSGTGFYQVAMDCQNEGKEFSYLALGIQHSGNTRELFNRADALKVEYVLAQDFHSLNLEKMKAQIQRFLDKTDAVCVAIDLDVFSASIAPGVSAPTAVGILYDHTFREIMKLLASSNKVVSLDMAEYNPTYDIDLRTAKLASQLIFDWVNWRFN